MNSFLHNERCVFCSDNKSVCIGNNHFISLNIHSKKLAITKFDKKNKLIGCLDVEYCPICGRALDELKCIKHNL